MITCIIFAGQYIACAAHKHDKNTLFERIGKKNTLIDTVINVQLMLSIIYF